MERSNRRAIVLAGCVALAAGLLAACSGGPAGERSAPSTSATTSTSSSTSTTVSAVAEPDVGASGLDEEDVTVVATSEVDVLDVFDEESDAEPARRLDRSGEVSGELVFVVEELATGPDGRHHVQLPVRPNGSTGWVRAQDVSLTSHAFRIEVDVGAHRLRVFESGEVLVEAPVGVGTGDTPTPGGTYYLKELLQPPDPGGPYGPYAYGLSGFSNALDSFAGGDAVIGIHGTDAPELVGADVSSGCIRVTNDVIEHLVEDIGLPLGVPVAITT